MDPALAAAAMAARFAFARDAALKAADAAPEAETGGETGAPQPSTASGAYRSPKRAKLAAGMFGLGAFAGLAIWGAVIVASWLRHPGLEGLLTGMFAGLFAGLLATLAGAWLAVRIVTPPKMPVPDSEEDVAAIADLKLAPVLAELEEVRLETMKVVADRARWMTPLGVVIGIALWALGKKPEIGDLPMVAGAAGLIGYAWAASEPGKRYARLYKQKVLPLLAASFGDLSYRPAIVPDIGRLRAEQLLRTDGAVAADDEIFGTYRGQTVSIVEMTVTSGGGENKQTIFNGFVVELGLPHNTNAVIAVVADQGDLGNIADRMRIKGRQRIRLEDPEFEKAYEVYGTDQIEGRALLNPAFMEKLLQLGRNPRFGVPLVLATDDKLMLLLPNRSGGRLFAAPQYSKPAASRDTLLALRRDLAMMLSAADAAIGLDRRFEG